MKLKRFNESNDVDIIMDNNDIETIRDAFYNITDKYSLNIEKIEVRFINETKEEIVVEIRISNYNLHVTHIDKIKDNIIDTLSKKINSVDMVKDILIKLKESISGLSYKYKVPYFRTEGNSITMLFAKH